MRILKENLQMYAVKLSGVNLKKHNWEKLQYIFKLERGVGMFSHHIFLSYNTVLDSGRIGELVMLIAVKQCYPCFLLPESKKGLSLHVYDCASSIAVTSSPPC